MNIGVFYGGRSYEHDISIITAVQAMAALDRAKYKVLPIYMNKGELYLMPKKTCVADYRDRLNSRAKLTFCGGGVKRRWKKIAIDCALLCCHGGEGEDGTLQALLEYYGIPYTSAGVLASAVAMDKSVAKMMFQSIELNCAKGVTVTACDDKAVECVENSLSYPMIIKPAHLGSSIGIKAAHCREELVEALEVGLQFDKIVLVEQIINAAKEYNCAAVSSKGEVIVGGIESPIRWNEFLTFEDKYVGGKMKDWGEKKKLSINEELCERITAITAKLYKELFMAGVVRVDYLYDSDTDTLYVNEVNTQPGSMAYYLFDSINISFTKLLDIIIEEGIRRFRGRPIIIFNTGVLDKLSVNTVK